MQAMMLYFSGSGIQIFSLGMIFMLLTNPLSAVLNIRKSASRPKVPLIRSVRAVPPCAVFVCYEGTDVCALDIADGCVCGVSDARVRFA